MCPTPRLLAIVLFSPWLLVARAEMPAITADNVFDFYAKFVRLTKEPHQVHPTIAELCTAHTAQAMDSIKRATGPHYDARVHFYANTPATRRTQKSEAFAPGSIIVKEKLGVGD